MNTPIEDILAELARHTFTANEKTKITCAHAHLVAKKCGVTLADLGRILNERKIKIAKCQLGCFE